MKWGFLKEKVVDKDPIKRGESGVLERPNRFEPFNNVFQFVKECLDAEGSWGDDRYFNDKPNEEPMNRTKTPDEKFKIHVLELMRARGRAYVMPKDKKGKDLRGFSYFDGPPPILGPKEGPLDSTVFTSRQLESIVGQALDTHFPKKCETSKNKKNCFSEKKDIYRREPGQEIYKTPLWALQVNAADTPRGASLDGDFELERIADSKTQSYENLPIKSIHVVGVRKVPNNRKLDDAKREGQWKAWQDLEPWRKAAHDIYKKNYKGRGRRVKSSLMQNGIKDAAFANFEDHEEEASARNNDEEGEEEEEKEEEEEEDQEEVDYQITRLELAAVYGITFS